MARTGLLDHTGVGVPDLAAAMAYYDELMPILGLKHWFPTSADGSFNYGPDGAGGSQLFFYQAIEPGTYSQHRTGLQHIAFMVATRAIVARGVPVGSVAGCGDPPRARGIPRVRAALRHLLAGPARVPARGGLLRPRGARRAGSLSCCRRNPMPPPIRSRARK